MLNEVVPGVAADAVEAHCHKKIFFKIQAFSSTSCTNAIRRNSYTVTYVDVDGKEKVCVIAHFLRVKLE